MKKRIIALFPIIFLFLTACQGPIEREVVVINETPTQTTIITATEPVVTPSPLPQPSPTLTPTAAATPPEEPPETPPILPTATALPTLTPPTEPQGEPALQPADTSKALYLDAWSDDGQWFAYWSTAVGDIRNTQPNSYPPGTLHVLNTETGEVCPHDNLYRTGIVDEYVKWQADNQLVVIFGETGLIGTPCDTDSFQNFAGDFGHRPSTYSNDPVNLDKTHEVETTILSREDGIVLGVTVMSEIVTGNENHRVEWSNYDALGSWGLNGWWISPTQFLLFQSRDEGPLILNLDGSLTEVIDLFGFERPPTYETDQFWYTPIVTAPQADGMFKIGLTTVGNEDPSRSNFIYHSESGTVEELPYKIIWRSFEIDGYLLVQETRDDTYLPTYLIRPINDINGEFIQLGERVSTLAKLPDQNVLFMAQNLSDGQNILTLIEIGSFTKNSHKNLGEYEIYHHSYAPTGDHFILLGVDHESLTQGIFHIETP